MGYNYDMENPLLLSAPQNLPVFVENEEKQGRKPTDRQIEAVNNYVGNGRKSKAEALREAGYGHSTVDHPKRVFNSPAVMELLEEYEITLEPVLKALHRRSYKARTLAHATFPPYNPPRAKEREAEDAETGEDNSEQIRGEQLTDQDIRDMYAVGDIQVQKIVHGELQRHVYYWQSDNRAQNDAAEKIINLYGLYAPRKTESKSEIVQFTLTGLRQKIREDGIDIVKMRYGGQEDKVSNARPEEEPRRDSVAPEPQKQTEQPTL
jgi:hypothetical protein